MTRLRSIARRPDFAAFVATAVVYVFFLWAGWPNFHNEINTANWMNFAAGLGVIALPVSLVMIAGHLDLSVGSSLAAGAMTYAVLAGHYEFNDWLGLVAGLAFGALIGLVNGLLVTRTKLPSFIVTLGMLFALQGLAFGLTRLITSNVQTAVQVDDTVKTIFAGKIFGTNFRMWIVFLIAMTLLVAWVLYRSRFGNWIYAIGGDETSARAAGVPVDRTLICLFIFSGFSSALVGVLQVARFDSAQVSAGQSYVFWSIIAVVVGGVLLTGGYGSPLGVVFGTLTFSIVFSGINVTGWNSDWSNLILGVLLLLAVLANNTFRRVALSSSSSDDPAVDTSVVEVGEAPTTDRTHGEEKQNV